jgi:ABC-type antimicrobial peptide transport system permease subunit
VALAPVLRDALRSVDPRLPLDRVLPLAQALAESGWNGRVSILLLYTVSIIAFLLAMVGLYAVTAHRVAQRIPEIGLRMAVGASAGQIAGLVLRGAIGQFGLGLALGLALILVFTRLFGPASDSLTALSMLGTFLALVVAVTLVAAAACIIPALRAARVDPATALRCE